MNGIEFTLVDPDLHVPVERSQAGTAYAPSWPPVGWQRRESGAWAYWQPDGHTSPAQGWKVHVSARLERAGAVLDTVAEVCARRGVPFKHVRSDWLFLWLHHKHGPRHQSGKFCTAYPGDADGARALMTALEAALPDERGPYVLTDRRFGASTAVSYRYGAFTGRSAVQLDGTRVPLLSGPDGTDVADTREAQFTLPAGVVDPFAPPPADAGAGEVTVHGYRFTAVLQFSNAGGAYRATAPDGRTVFVKEARGDNGYQWDRSTAMQRLQREHETLEKLHVELPGVGPAPVDYFRHWEHEFLVTELVPGLPLTKWTSQHNPLARTGATDAMHRAYHDRCRAILATLGDQLDRLHAAGYAFVDLNPRNVLVDADDRPRLIDFEEAQRLDDPRPVHGAEGFIRRADRDATTVDDYALAAITQFLLYPLHGVLDRHPAAAAHLGAALPVLPVDLWRRAGRFRPAGGPSPMPDPDTVADAPERWLWWLAGSVATGLAQTCEPREAVPYPLGVPAYATNPHCLAYGTAGVLYALHHAGMPVDPRVVRTLRDAVLADPDGLPPGLLVGTAGLAWLFADLGDLDAARAMLAATDRQHRAVERATGSAAGGDATLVHGRAGIALAHLKLHRHDGDGRHLTRAAELLAAVPDGAAVIPALGADERTGWLGGRPGIALALHHLAAATGDPAAARRGRALLLADLEHAVVDGDGLQFRVSRKDRRIEPYLACGSAGFALVAGRYVDAGTAADDPLLLALRRCLTTVQSLRFPMLPSLFEGLAGMGLVLSDLATEAGDPALRAAAVRTGTGLFRHAVPRGAGVGFLSPTNRFSADLIHGAAGVLLFLGALQHGRPDTLFTLGAQPADPAGRTP